MIQKQRSNKTQVGDLLNAPVGYRGSLESKGIKPKDHTKDNYKKLREIQNENRLKKEEEENKKPSEPWKMKKFQNIESTIGRTINVDKRPSEVPKSKEEEKRSERLTTAALARHSSQPAAQKGPTKIEEAPVVKKKAKAYDENIYSMGGEAHNLKIVQYDEAAQESTRDTGVPRANETNSLAPRKDKNYVDENRKKALEKASKTQTTFNSQQPQDTKNPNYGKVPTYIKEFNKQAEEKKERKQKEIEDSKVPAGTRLMSEEERMDTLKALEESKKEINQMLDKMPISMKTLALEQKKKDLEAKLMEVNKAITTFSRKKVYIAL